MVLSTIDYSFVIEILLTDDTKLCIPYFIMYKAVRITLIYSYLQIFYFQESKG